MGRIRKKHKKEDIFSFLDMHIEDLDLSVRTYNALRYNGVKSLGELATLEISDLIKFRNFGRKSLLESEKVLHNYGLHFGYDLFDSNALSNVIMEKCKQVIKDEVIKYLKAYEKMSKIKEEE